MHKSDKVFIGVIIATGLVFFMYLKSKEVTPDMRATAGIEALCNSGYREYCMKKEVQESKGSEEINIEHIDTKVAPKSLDKKDSGDESTGSKSLRIVPEKRTKTNVQIETNSQDTPLSKTIKETGFEIAPANQNNISEGSATTKSNTSKYQGMEDWSTTDLENYYNNQNEENMIDAYENSKY